VRRLPILLALAVALAAAGAGAAATINGTSRGETIRGTPGADVIDGRAGNDRIDGLGGSDALRGGTGADRLSGGDGNDRLAAQGDGTPDRVLCGAGDDVANIDGRDAASADCELVARRISRAVGRIGGQPQTEVEPDSFSWGRTVVAAFQVGRYAGGGAAAIGWARSRNGRTWRAGLLPGLRPKHNSSVVVSDPVVAYDARHRTWLVAALRAGEDEDGLLVSRSRNGLAWKQALVAARGDGDTFDKDWIACDNGRRSPFRGHCYLSYWNVPEGTIETRVSTDGGATWSGPVAVRGLDRARGEVNGAQPVIRPDGTLLVVYVSYLDGVADVILAARSTDGAHTFADPVQVAEVSERDVYGMRSPLLPSAAVDAGGRIYVAWHECGLRPDCAGDDLILATSADGRTWSDARRIPAALGFPDGSDFFTPALAVRPGTRGSGAHVAVTYYVAPPCELGTCEVRVGLVESTNGGATWRIPQRLDAQAMDTNWIADGGFGQMLADYISTSWFAGRPVAVFALSSPPIRGQLRQSIFAARVPPSGLRKR